VKPLTQSRANRKTEEEREEEEERGKEREIDLPEPVNRSN
jgi:hypothetical protein